MPSTTFVTLGALAIALLCCVIPEEQREVVWGGGGLIFVFVEKVKFENRITLEFH